MAPLWWLTEPHSALTITLPSFGRSVLSVIHGSAAVCEEEMTSSDRRAFSWFSYQRAAPLFPSSVFSSSNPCSPPVIRRNYSPRSPPRSLRFSLSSEPHAHGVFVSALSALRFFLGSRVTPPQPLARVRHPLEESHCPISFCCNFSESIPPSPMLFIIPSLRNG